MIVCYVPHFHLGIYIYIYIDNSDFTLYLPYQHLSYPRVKSLAWWWGSPNVSPTFYTSDVWQTLYQYIPTRKMLEHSITTTASRLFAKEHPHMTLPSPSDMMQSFGTPNTPWIITFYKNLRHDHNSHNSGIVQIGDSVLVETTNDLDELDYQCMKLSHVVTIWNSELNWTANLCWGRWYTNAPRSEEYKHNLFILARKVYTDHEWKPLCQAVSTLSICYPVCVIYIYNFIMNAVIYRYISVIVITVICVITKFNLRNFIKSFVMNEVNAKF